MTTVQLPSAPPDHDDVANAAGVGTPSPGDRGVTIVAPIVFERLAVRAATEVPGVEGEVRTGAARLLPWVAGASADASAEVADNGVSLDLTFNVAYPEPVRRVADAVRDRVTERIQTFTGRPVRKINITVPQLVRPVRHRPRAR